MAERGERRSEGRLTLREAFPVEVRGEGPVHLLDLSLVGARIEHFDLRRPGTACTLDLFSPVGILRLPARVVWCTVIGRRRTRNGEFRLVARSGLQFPTLTETQQLALAGALQHLGEPATPTLDSPRGSA